jgi:hypothetical protein
MPSYTSEINGWQTVVVFDQVTCGGASTTVWSDPIDIREYGSASLAVHASGATNGALSNILLTPYCAISTAEGGAAPGTQFAAPAGSTAIPWSGEAWQFVASASGSLNKCFPATHIKLGAVGNGSNPADTKIDVKLMLRVR